MATRQLAAFAVWAVAAVAAVAERLPGSEPPQQEAALTEVNSTCKKTTSGGELQILQITDMQLGMSTCCSPFPSGEDPGGTDDFSKEEGLLQAVVARILADGFQESASHLVFIGGDMQDAWPHIQNPVIQKRAINQVAAVKEALQPLAERFPNKFIVTPGNHDIADDPTATHVKLYTERWLVGSDFTPIWQSDMKGLHGVKLIDEQFLVFHLNSQLYAKTAVSEYSTTQARLQTEWLQERLTNLAEETVNVIVVLTHIPPFMNDKTEAVGWANWDLDHRNEVLGMLEQTGKKVVFVCGHFHASVFKTVGNFQILTMTAAGTTLRWDGDSTLAPAHASDVASMDIGGAFTKRILPDMANRRPSDPASAGYGILRFTSEGLNPVTSKRCNANGVCVSICEKNGKACKETSDEN